MVLFILIRIPVAAARGILLCVNTVVAFVFFVLLSGYTLLLFWIIVNAACGWAHAGTSPLDPQEPLVIMIQYYTLQFMEHCLICRMLPNLEISIELWHDAYRDIAFSLANK